MIKFCIIQDEKPIKAFSTQILAEVWLRDAESNLEIRECHIYTIADIEGFGIRRATQNKFRKLLKMELVKDYIDGREKQFYTRKQYIALLVSAGWEIIDDRTIAKKVIRLD